MVRSAFNSAQDGLLGLGKRPVVFDIIAPDKRTSLLGDLKLVLHVNPSTMQISYTKVVERLQTMGGFVEQHWGQAPSEISLTGATGGFVRLFSGLSNITGPTPSNPDVRPTAMQAQTVGGTRRDTIAYDKYLDFLAMYKNNGSIYDTNGNVALQGQILMMFDGGMWWGYFTDFGVEETAEQPYQFSITATFQVEREKHLLRTINTPISPTGG